MTTVVPQEKALHFSVQALSPVIGAKLTGASLAEASDESIVAVRRSLLEHKVLFFRDQELSQKEQISFASRLGELTGGHPTLPSAGGKDYVLELDSLAGGRADHWHTDVTFALEPPAISVLRAVKVPEVGGDTQWASTEAAYRRLPEPLKHLAAELHALHTNAYDYGRPPLEAESEAARRHREQFVGTVFETEHPVVRVHPETGQPSLLLGGFAQQLVGLPPEVSRDLLRVFHSYVVRPEHIVRWRWRPGDVAIWDNRATQHYAVNDYGDAHRVVQRVTVSGTSPVGLDGWQSVARKGDSSAYQSGYGASVPVPAH
ncbi:MAG TPA: TauD/TfdA family dioxygenase [Acidimicrobiales bacterium]|nr:TauD/TfdA family dioxygenase [Acidimicrobiales bacterium]